MMETIRTAANNIVVKIIFGIIILAFIFTGVGGFFGLSSNANDEQLYIAKVDGEGLSRAAFEDYARERTNNIQTMELSPEYKQSLIKEIRRNALDVQINNYLIYQLADSLKITISDEQVKNAIRAQTVFFENGKFSNQRYLDLLRQNNYTPDQYAESIRSSLMPEQLITALFLSDFTLPVDSDVSILEDQKRTAYVANFDSSLLERDQFTFTEEEQKQYYDANQASFYKPERVKLKYVTNFRPDIIAAIKVTDDDVKKEYNKNLTSKYTFPAKHLYSVINIEDEKEANAVYKKLTAGTDFDTLANEVKALSPYGNSNGSIGWFSVDDSLPTFLTDAKLTKKGAIAKPVKTEDGYVIIKLVDVNAAKPMSFDYAAPSIKQALAIEQETTAYDKIEQKLEQALAKNPKSISELAELSGMTEFESTWSYQSEISSIVRFPEIRDVAFSDEMIQDGKPTGKISDIIISNQYNSSFVLQVIDYRPEGVAPFDEVKDDIVKTLQTNAANNAFAELVAQIKDDFDSKGRSDKLSLANRYILTRNSDQLDKEVVKRIFDAVPSADNKTVFIVDEVAENKGFVAALIKVEQGEYRDISEQITPIMLTSAQQGFIQAIRSTAKIEMMPNANL